MPGNEPTSLSSQTLFHFRNDRDMDMDIDKAESSPSRENSDASVLSRDDLEAAQALEELRAGNTLCFQFS